MVCVFPWLCGSFPFDSLLAAPRWLLLCSAALRSPGFFSVLSGSHRCTRLQSCTCRKTLWSLPGLHRSESSGPIRLLCAGFFSDTSFQLQLGKGESMCGELGELGLHPRSLDPHSSASPQPPAHPGWVPLQAEASCCGRGLCSLVTCCGGPVPFAICTPPSAGAPHALQPAPSSRPASGWVPARSRCSSRGSPADTSPSPRAPRSLHMHCPSQSESLQC